MTAPELVIFDCDGVLVDSEPISNEVLARVLTACGLPTSTADALSIYKGRIMRDVVARAEERLGGSLPPDFVQRFESAREVEFRRRLRAVDGAAEAVERVRAAGVGVAVATQGKPEKTELTLGLTGLRPLFDDDAIFTAYAVPRGKPHPDLFLHVAEARGATPDRCVVVEDTTIGVRAGVAAGMRVLGYASAGGETDRADGEPEAGSEPGELADAGAEPFGSLHELPRLLGV